MFNGVFGQDKLETYIQLRAEHNTLSLAIDMAEKLLVEDEGDLEEV